jgi:hypothetical protein
MKTKAKSALGAQIIRSKGGHLALRMNAMITKDQESRIQKVLDDNWAKVEQPIINEVAKILGTEIRKG